MRRHRPCALLHEQGIPYTHWFEDALSALGSKTVAFMLHLLVRSESLGNAEACLRRAGWVDGQLSPYAFQFFDPTVDKHVVLTCPDATEFDLPVVLLSADTWPGPFATTLVEHELTYPALPDLYNALAQRFLDSNNAEFRRYVMLMLNYLYLDSREVKTAEFAGCLPRDIQQLHLDILSNDLHMLPEKTVDTLKKECDGALFGAVR